MYQEKFDWHESVRQFWWMRSASLRKQKNIEHSLVIVSRATSHLICSTWRYWFDSSELQRCVLKQYRFFWKYDSEDKKLTIVIFLKIDDVWMSDLISSRFPGARINFINSKTLTVHVASDRRHVCHDRPSRMSERWKETQVIKKIGGRGGNITEKKNIFQQIHPSFQPKKKKKNFKNIKNNKKTNQIQKQSSLRNITEDDSQTFFLTEILQDIVQQLRKKKKTIRTIEILIPKDHTPSITLRPSDVQLVITFNFWSRVFLHLDLLIYHFISFELHILFTDPVISLLMRRFQYNK